MWSFPFYRLCFQYFRLTTENDRKISLSFGMWPMKVVVGYFQIVAVYLLSRKQIYRLFTFSFVLYSVYWIVCVLSCTMKEENEECWLIRGRLHLTCHLIFDIHFLLFAHLRRLQQWMVDLFCRLFSWHQKHFMYFNTIWSTVMHSLMPVASFIAFFPLYYDQIFTFPSLPFNQCVLCALCALSVLCIWSFYICFFPCRFYSVVVLVAFIQSNSLFCCFFLSFGYISQLILTFRWHLHWNKDVCRSSCGICFAFVLYWCVICARWEFRVWP